MSSFLSELISVTGELFLMFEPTPGASEERPLKGGLGQGVSPGGRLSSIWFGF